MYMLDYSQEEIKQKQSRDFVSHPSQAGTSATRLTKISSACPLSHWVVAVFLAVKWLSARRSCAAFLPRVCNDLVVGFLPMDAAEDRFIILKP